MEQFTLGIGGYIVIGLLVLWAGYSLFICENPKAVKRGAFGTGDGSIGVSTVVIVVLLIAGIIWLLRAAGVETK